VRVNTCRTLSASDLTNDRDGEEPAFSAWREQWKARLARQPNSTEQVSALMRRSNPAFIPRNHKVEEALTAATERGDLSVMDQLLDVLASPYDHARDQEAFSRQPDEGAPRYRTFCGT
jgi:serine/tyrosine/threonine adenylyltransferase